jgi:small subunit ribosomal protein S20
MPVTTTAKRALRGSKNKESVNKVILGKLDVAVRVAKKSKSLEKVLAATSLADKAAKKRVIHKNKAARIKSQLSKLLIKATKTKSKTSKKA